MSRKKILVIGVALSILAAAALGGGVVFARAAAPWIQRSMMGWTGGMMGGGYGGMMGGSYAGMMGGQAGPDSGWMDQMHDWMMAPGGMHDQVWKGLANALGLTTDQLNAGLQSGKTLAQLAQEKGISQDQLAAALETAMKAGLDQAVGAGVMTRAQADAMLAHMSGRYLWMLQMMSQWGMSTGAGVGGCPGRASPAAAGNS